MQQDYADLRIPKITRTKDPKPGEWHEKTTWDQINLNKDYVYLSQFAKQTREDLFKALNKAYPEIHRRADQLFRKQRVEPPRWPPESPPPSEPGFSFTPPPSGFRGH